jgi:tRNA splicing ligase
LSFENTAGVENIIASFIYKRDPLDVSADPDAKLDSIIDLNWEDDLSVHIEKVCQELNLEIPSKQSIDEAIKLSIEYKEDIRAAVKNAKAKYYGVRIGSELYSKIEAIISIMPGYSDFWIENSASFASYSKHLHITIVVRSKKSEYSELLEEFDMRSKALYSKNEQDTASDNLRIGAPVSVVFSQILYNDRVCCAIVESTDPSVPSMNKNLHITLAKFTDDAKPFESNALIETWLKDPSSVNTINLGTSMTMIGEVAAFFN